MATKGKNKNGLRRKVRQATKNVNRDIGPKGNAKFIRSGWGSGVSPKDFPKMDGKGPIVSWIVESLSGNSYGEWFLPDNPKDDTPAERLEREKMYAAAKSIGVQPYRNVMEN